MSPHASRGIPENSGAALWLGLGLADIATTMIYVQHVPQHAAADRLSARMAKTSTTAAALDRTRPSGRMTPRVTRLMAL